MNEVLKFEEVIDDSNDRKLRRHLLLGNGFSIACQNKIFAYDSLYSNTDFHSLQHVKQIFKRVDTKDFEHVIRMLKEASLVVGIYDDKSSTLSNRLCHDADCVKNILVETIARSHPDVPDNIDNNKYRSCRRFLQNFIGNDNAGHIYTLNYDLLLYWALLHNTSESDDSNNLSFRDGFGSINGDLKWSNRQKCQNIYYLHGALHLFASHGKIKKHRWTSNGTSLKQQAQEAIERDMFPLFVAEGTSSQKSIKIDSNSYLRHAYKNFSEQMNDKSNCLFIFGHSLDTKDQHILKKIKSGQVTRIYVGLHKVVNDQYDNKVRCAARNLTSQHNEVVFFDAASANVWH